MSLQVWKYTVEPGFHSLAVCLEQWVWLCRHCWGADTCKSILKCTDKGYCWGADTCKSILKCTDHCEKVGEIKTVCFNKKNCVAHQNVTHTHTHTHTHAKAPIYTYTHKQNTHIHTSTPQHRPHTHTLKQDDLSIYRIFFSYVLKNKTKQNYNCKLKRPGRILLQTHFINT